MADYIYKDGELKHHVILGMKWGVRRYQNKNGTLTAAGKKRYDREVEKAKTEARVLRNRQATANKIKKLEEMQAKNKAKRSALDGKGELDVSTKNKSKSASSSEPRKKTIREMSNEEIQARIDRIRLENTLKELTPQKVSAGKKFVDTMLDVGKDAAKTVLADTGKAAINKWLGLDDSDFKKLEKKSKVAELKKKIAESEMSERKNRKEKEKDESEAAASKAKAKKEADEKARSETYEYTSGYHHDSHSKSSVSGEGTSRYREKTGPVYDADWREVSEGTTALGQRRVAGLLEDKRKKKK